MLCDALKDLSKRRESQGKSRGLFVAIVSLVHELANRAELAIMIGLHWNRARSVQLVASEEIDNDMILMNY